jgi:DNA/RNA endonuclease YhcR with UshA esterase domain
MKEKLLLKIALMVSLIGVVSLFFISSNIDVEQKSIEKITFDDIDKHVKVQGTVNEMFENDKVMIIDIVQPTEITVVLFKRNNESLAIKKWDNIEVIGKVDEYEGRLEIIGNRVRVIG